jgi:hypothetical protein
MTYASYMSDAYAVRNSKGKLIDYSKKKSTTKKNNVSNLEKKFALLNQKMKHVQSEDVLRRVRAFIGLIVFHIHLIYMMVGCGQVLRFGLIKKYLEIQE